MTFREQVAEKVGFELPTQSSVVAPNDLTGSVAQVIENLREECRARGPELPTFWLPRQTVKVKFTLIKSFRFKEWCARGDSNSRPSGS